MACMVHSYVGYGLTLLFKGPLISSYILWEQRHVAANTTIVVSTECQSGILKMFSCLDRTRIAFHLENIQRVFGGEGNLSLGSVIMEAKCVEIATMQVIGVRRRGKSDGNIPCSFDTLSANVLEVTAVS